LATGEAIVLLHLHVAGIVAVDLAGHAEILS
jgi:hypothetical protein